MAADTGITRVIITSGKVYYDLLQAREDYKIDNIAIMRTEQYYPFPYDELKDELERYGNADIVWVQEEPKNMGAWTFVAPCIEEVLEELGRKGDRPTYVGRKMAASPAAGYLKIHNREQEALIAEALNITRQ